MYMALAAKNPPEPSQVRISFVVHGARAARMHRPLSLCQVVLGHDNEMTITVEILHELQIDIIMISCVLVPIILGFAPKYSTRDWASSIPPIP